MHEAHKQTSFNRTRRLLVVMLPILFGLVAAGPSAAQTATPAVENDAAQTVFRPFQCEFVRDVNSARISTIFFDVDGLPLALDRFTVTVENIDSGQIVAPDRVQVAPVTQRAPLSLTIVLDITDTVPIEEIVNALRNGLLPNLQPADEIAVLTFAETVAPRSRFYPQTEREQLVAQQLAELLPGEGDNRLLDALFAAVIGFPTGAERRQVVLLVTDSQSRGNDDITRAILTERAASDTVEIYAVGFNTGIDQPSDEELRAITSATGGLTWIYTDEFITRSGIEAGVSDLFGAFVETLDSEIDITVDLAAQQPNTNGLVRFELQALFDDSSSTGGRISCPVEELTHSITFASDPDGLVINEATDIAVTVASDLDREDVVVRFLQNGEVVQEGAGDSYTFDPTTAAPGSYTLSVELLNRVGDVLATTTTTSQVTVQAPLNLIVQDGNVNNLTGAVELEVFANPLFDLPPVDLFAATADAPDDSRQLTEAGLTFAENGRAALVVPDIQSQMQALFPAGDGTGGFTLEARVTAPEAGQPPLALSNPVEIGVGAGQAPVAPAEAAPTPGPSAPDVPASGFNFDFTFGIDARWIPWLLTLALFIFNFLLARWIRRARIRRMIDVVDDYELSPQLMTITVRREGVKQTHPLTRKTVTIGRGSSNDINLGDDPNISRQHGVIMWRRANWYYSNRKPRAFARISNKRYTGYRLHELKPVTEIEIGGALLVFHSNAQQDISEFIDTNL